MSKIIADPGRSRRLQENVRRNISVRTHYSGKGTFETLCHWLNLLFIQFGFCGSTDVVIATSHACDIDKTCITVLKSMEDDEGEGLVDHIFGDINERVDPAVLAKLELFEIGQCKTGQEALERGELMTEVIFEHLLQGTLRKPSLKAHCHVHDGQCPAHSKPTLHHRQAPQTAIVMDSSSEEEPPANNRRLQHVNKQRAAHHRHNPHTAVKSHCHSHLCLLVA